MLVGVLGVDLVGGRLTSSFFIENMSFTTEMIALQASHIRFMSGWLMMEVGNERSQVNLKSTSAQVFTSSQSILNILINSQRNSHRTRSHAKTPILIKRHYHSAQSMFLFDFGLVHEVFYFAKEAYSLIFGTLVF